MPAIASEFSLAAEIAAGDEITLVELAHNQRTNPSTAFRWVQKGLPSGYGTRVKLEAIKRGKRWITSRAAVARFFSALPASTPTPSPPIRTPSKRERDSARAEATLKNKYGI